MYKLGALDANFLYTETEMTPNNIASIQRLELPEGVSASDYVVSLRGYMQQRLHLMPYLHRKLKFVPGNLDHPFWVEAGKVDLNKHIVEIPLEVPGSMAQLEQKIAELHSVNMDRSRPLWAMYIITGLEDGTVANYNQIHHAAVDGMAGQLAITTLMDTTPEHPSVEPVAGVPASHDGIATLLQMSMENLFRYQIGTATRVLGGMESMRRVIQRAVDPSRKFGALFETAPRTRFNHPVGKARSYAMGECALTDVKNMGKQLGASINDVFLAVCAGGLRRYLARHDELPETGLIAGCPVSLRRPGDKNLGNAVTMMNVNLGTHIEDPKLRLMSIHESAQIAKEVTADLADGFDSEVSLLGLPAMLSMAASAAERTGAADRLPIPMNVVISNVPGPREELFFNGARMLTHYPVSIPAHGVGLNITVQSYRDKMYFALTACEKAIGDADVLRDDILAAYVELRQLLMPNNVSAFRTALAPAAPAGSEDSPAADPVTRVA